MTDPTFDQPTQARSDEPTETLRRERPTQSLDLTSAPSDGSTTAFLDAVAASQGEPSGTGPGSGDQGADDENDSDENDSDLFGDEQWDRPPRTNRLTRVLLMAILVVAGFGGGVLVQKHAGSSSGSVSSFPSGFPAGGFSPGAGGGTSAAAGGSGAASSQAPVVVGTVKSVSGTTVLVANFAGAVVKVTVPATATVTTPGLTPLAAGETVSVSGAKKADGSVVATAIVARAAG